MFSGHGPELWSADVGPWQQVVDLAVRVTVDDPGEHVSKIAERLDTVELAGFDERGDDGPMFGTAIRAGKERILAVERHHPFILPMSVRSWKFITRGIRILAARSACGELSSE
jgi:hypothetical protein